ncbi:MAG: histidine--tRNA ligase [Candidatus Saccharimonadales bacterium]
MSLSTQPYKGARDFYPEDKRLQKYMFTVMSRVAESYGYEAYDAPILEPTDLFLSKGNEEIIQEQTYTFTDRGDRSVTIRTEMTPSVSRMVAGKRQELAYPLRWYSIPNLWRYERMQRGRLREFWQLNVDIFGVADISAELEIIQIADDTLKAYGAKPDMYAIRINSRELVDYIMRDYFELSEVEASTVIRLIDRMHKMDQAAFIAQLDAIVSPSQRESGLTEHIVKLLGTKKVSDLPEEVRSHSSVFQLQQLSDMLEASKITNARFDITLMRGFDYYTGIVFEVFDTDPENNRAMFGGGRYDGLIGSFGVEPIPTVGFGMGDVTLQNFLESHNLLPDLPTETDAYVILIGDILEKAQPVLMQLRSLGLNIAVDGSQRKLDKQIKTAMRKNIPYIIFVGENELASGEFKLRNITTSTEETHGISRLVSVVKDRRKKIGVHSSPRHEDVEDLDDLDNL